MTTKRITRQSTRAVWSVRGTMDVGGNLDDFLSFTDQDFGGSETNFQQIAIYNCTLRKTKIRVAVGAFDQEVKYTVRIGGVDTTKEITIPASAGAAIYNDTSNIAVDEDDLISVQITGTAGTGSTIIRSRAQEYSLP